MKKHFPQTRYMLIDVANPDAPELLMVADIKRTQLHGVLLKAQGRNIIAPPAADHGFLKLTQEGERHLFRTIVGGEVPTDLRTLEARVLTVVNKLPMDDANIEGLEAAVRALTPEEGSEKKSTEKKRRAPADPTGRPPATTTTGFVWDICDKLAASAKGLPDRKAVMAACEAEGINKSTASTQYSKWKNAQAAAV